MTDYLAAIGRDVGKVDTDAGGLARYSLKLQVPPGIRNGTEPELSLEYCQGAPNGSLGVGWALGGVSVIRKAPSNLAFDDINPPPATYDRAASKLTLDGAELLNIQGDYGGGNAQYTTEVDGSGRTVTPFGTGFQVLDATGRRLEYGTTDDSLILTSSDKTPKEWRLKRNIDYHGNTIVYKYSSSPQPGGSTTDSNACYLSAIEYTSNIFTDHPASRLISFEYSSRPDLVVQTAQGEKSVYASLLVAVRFSVLKSGGTPNVRSYELSYDVSKVTGDSRIISITETAFDGTKKINLTPSTFGYTDAGVAVKDVFKTATGAARTIKLQSIQGSIALFPMNISGRSLADIACVKLESQRLSIKTYLASRNDDGTISWSPSTGRGAEAALPLMNLTKGFPSIVTPDINSDGRPDLVVPYADSSNFMRFSISQCIGTGFQNYTEKQTKFKWVDNAKFMTMDVTGKGPSIIQIFPDRNKITLRNFPTFSVSNQVGLNDAVDTETSYEDKGTIDWIQLTHSSNGAKSLVRVWLQDLGSGQSQFKATPFTIHNTAEYDGKFKEGPTSLLGKPFRSVKAKYTVLSCDINADGVQDIVLATANYEVDKMNLTFSTYLGDGNGSFSSHGDSIIKTSPAVRPLKALEYGEFHLTNLNGSNYPSISYVYQAINKKYYCFSVDGESDGLYGHNEMYTIADDMPTNDMQVAPADLNGNGIGDWLFHTVENHIPRLLPVYNSTQNVDLLSWARDPMGLRTTITYGPLSDPAVYTSDVQWDKYENTDRTSYPIISAPNCVVSRLDHTNDSAINSLNFHVSITKSYANASVNVLGRGWLGFKQIYSTNTEDGVLTIETYNQHWPLVGIKKQVETKTATGEVLKSVKTGFENPSTARGEWKTYRINRVFEQTEHYEGGLSVRMKTMRTEYDSYGNVTLYAINETHGDQIVHQSFKRCSYTVLDGVTGFLTGEKLSTKMTNMDMSRYEVGDVTLVLYVNEHVNKIRRTVLKNTLTWSSQANKFISKEFTFDDYGRQVRYLDAAGVETATSYDTVFQTFPVKTVQSGPGFTFVNLKAFDGATGMEVANLSPDGSLACYKVDVFGRTTETRALASTKGPQTVKADLFLSQMEYAADPALQIVLNTNELDPQRTIAFEKFNSPQGLAYVGTRIKTYAGPDAKGQGEVLEYITCARQIRKRSSWNGNDSHKTCVCWDFDSRGQQIFASYPTSVNTLQELDWWPTKDTPGVRSTYDSLGRQSTRIRPAHNAPGQYILTSFSHLDGGARIQEKTLSTNDGSGQLGTGSLLCTIERRYVEIDNEHLVIENTNENGLRSDFRYDILGRLITTKDPSGQEESRVIDSLGNLILIKNNFQQATKSSKALNYVYNAAGHMTEFVNAAGELVETKPDATGRVLTKTGADGRTVQYTYEGANKTSVSSIKVFPKGSSMAFETCFDIVYDHRGRPSEQKLTLADGSTFITKVEHDWQDRVTRKVLPDGTILTIDYNGAEILSRSLSDGNAGAWNMKAETTQYNAFGKPLTLEINGTGLKEAFSHVWEYDSQGFPTKHSLNTPAKTLVQEYYTYNNTDQIKRKHEFVSGETLDYTYKGRRLVSSQGSRTGTRSYDYDNAGNLVDKRGTTLTYTAGQVNGIKNGNQEFEIVYDDAGRTVKRTTANSKLAFTYDSLGALTSINDSISNTSVSLVSNAEGEMLQRKHSDGSSDLFISDDLIIHTRTDGKREFRHQLTAGDHIDNTQHVVATVTTVHESKDSSRALSGQRSSRVHFTDTQGNITHVFNGDDTALRKKLEYDEYGLLDHDEAAKVEDDAASTYEGKFYDVFSGLLCFGARWYDPLVGRFTIPDDILDVASFLRSDGLNRYVFENNDPINHVDPTGHWSWHAILGVVVGVVLIVAAVAVTVATLGTAAPLLAGAIIGALAAGGIAGVEYSIKHKDEEDAGKFWGGFATTVAINAAIGAVTGAAGAAAAPARMASMAARIAVRAAVGGTTSVLQKAAERGVENKFYGTHHDLFEGAAKTFAGGALVGVIAGGVADKFEGGASKAAPFKLSAQAILQPKQANAWVGVGSKLVKEAAKEAGKALGKSGAQLGSGLADQFGWKAVAMDYAESKLKTGLKKLGEMGQHSAPMYGPW